MFSRAFVIAPLLVSGVAAWGNLGHETVGYVAQAFLAPKALAFVQSSLGSTYSQSLGVAATWADTVKYETAYEWSAPLHFVDALDAPLSGQCSVSESRDCGNGQCILTAIANYTARVANTGLAATQRQEALKFIDHFLGDIGQPLHVENYEVGGNDIDTKCNGKSTNLHATWDTGMLETSLDASYGSSAQTYATTLVARIQTGAYAANASSWISCSSTTTPLSSRATGPVPSLEAEIRAVVRSANVTSLDAREIAARAAITPLQCPLVWAQEANAYDCSFVFNYATGTDLCTGTYYKQAIPIIDYQLAKQGYRLAAWLNVIFDGATNLP